MIAVAAIAVAANGCDTVRHRQLLTETQVALDSPVVNLPVVVRKGLFVAEGSLHPDGRSVSMLVDTGAFESKLTAETAAAVGIVPLLHRGNSDTFGRRRDMPVGQAPELRFGGIAIERLSVGLLDWPESAITPCLAPDGLLGANALRGLSWGVDFAAPSLKVSDDPRRLDVPSTASRLDVSMPDSSATPKLTAVVEGRPVHGLLLDLGSNGGLVLPRHLLKELGISRERQVVIDDASSSGIYGAARQNSVRAPVRLQLGDLAPIEVMAEFTSDSGAKLGTSVLSHFRLWLDHDARKLSVVAADQPEAFAQRRLPHGILPAVDWARDRWKIAYLEYPATATSAPQVAVGDRFDTINGYRPGDLFTGWCDYVAGVRDWLETQAKLKLVDRSSGGLREVTISRRHR